MGGVKVVVIGGTDDVVITGADDAGGNGDVGGVKIDGADGNMDGVEASGEVDSPSLLQETAAVRRHTVNIALIQSLVFMADIYCARALYRKLSSLLITVIEIN